MSKPLTILSIDFDYFVDENRLFDWGHREQVFFLETIWHIRAHSLAAQGKTLEQAVPFRGNPIQFLFNSLSREVWNYSLAVAESHAAIVPWLNENFPGETFRIINVDAHHDLFYSAAHHYKEFFDCGSWGRHMIENGRIASWLQIYPYWRRKYPEETGRIFAWARKHIKLAVAEKLRNCRPDAIFLCRSGCWVPPCYDAKFTELVKVLNGQPLQERKLIEIDPEAVNLEQRFLLTMGKR